MKSSIHLFYFYRDPFVYHFKNDCMSYSGDSFWEAIKYFFLEFLYRLPRDQLGISPSVHQHQGFPQTAMEFI